MKKRAKAALTALLLFFMLCVPALAADGSRSFSFSLTSDNGSTITANLGSEFTVDFTLRRTDSSEEWAMYAWQTEIAYDAEAFEIVEGSVTVPDGVGSSLHLSGSTGKVYFNDFSFSKSGDSYPAVLEGCSFRLRVIGQGGEYSIRNTNYKVSTEGGMDTYSAEAADLTVTVRSVRASERFTDVPAGSWYEEAIGFVTDRGLFQGTSDTTFSPELSMTRAMLVTVLWRLDGKPSPSAAAGFDDVPGGQWYSEAVSWAAANGIVDGYGDGRFGPDDPITREQMAVILYRYCAFKGYETSEPADISRYDDAESVSSWAREAMCWANGAGLITGMTETTLAPKETATRAQVATILMRFVRLMK
jgi:hypothetical protein